MSITLQPSSKKCPFCAEMILSEAVKCRYCGEIVDPAYFSARSQPPVTPRYNPVEGEKYWHPGVAAVLSFLIPGMGQMYKGEIGAGILWFFVTLIGYFLLVIPGLVLHIICIVSAASGDPYKKVKS